MARFKNGQCIDESEVESSITRRYLEHVMRLSLVQDGLGSRVGLYLRDVGTHALGIVPEVYRLPLSLGVLVRFLRFRLGCHHLRVNTGRWVQPPLPRRQRVCLRCHSECLDNETHCLLVCSHPTMVDAREKMHAVIPLAFMHNMATYAQFWGVLGRLLSPDMVYATVKFVAVCTRVAWFSHSSGGYNAHLLPEVLVDTDTHLDLSESEKSENASDFEELIIEVQANG